MLILFIRSTTEGALLANLSLPSTSYTVVDNSSNSSSSSTSVDDNSDSDYIPKQYKQSRNHSKKSSRKFAEKEHKRPCKTRTRNKRSRDSYSSEDSDFKKRSSARIAKNRRYSSSDSSSSESSPTKCNEKRLRKEKCNAKGKEKFVEKEGSYSNVDSFDGDSSVESDCKTKTNKCDRRYVLKKKCSLGSNDYTAKRKRTMKSQERPWNEEKSKSNSKDSKCKNRQSRSRSTSLSSNASEQNKISSYKHRDSRGTSEHRSQDDNALMNKVTTRKQLESKSKSKSCYFSDSEDDRLRSSSQCSNRSNKSYSHLRRYIRAEIKKIKDRRKDKDRNRSSSRTCNLSQAAASPTVSSSTSAKDESYPTKHSDCTENRKSSRPSYKESKHRKSQSEKMSRSRKRRRRLRSLSTSQSE